MQRLLLLGATGFIGSQVLNILRNYRGLRLMVLGHRNVDYRGLEDVDLIVDDLTRFDLTCIQRFQPDTIIHMARLGGRGQIGRSVAAWRGRRANRRLVGWLCEHAPNIHVIYVSGTLVYGDHGESPVDESSAINPVGFAREYFRAEEPWIEAARDGKLPVTMVRPPWIVGQGSWFHSHFVLPALDCGSVPMYGSGQNWMTFIDIRDCAGMIVHLAERAAPGRVFNLFAPGQSARQVDFVRALSGLLGAEIREVREDKFRGMRDRALWEALTFSLKCETRHAEDCNSYKFQVPTWQKMIERNLPSEVAV